jgi:hypothetical protein
MNPPTVPHPRDIDKGMHGDDVIAVKHALSRAGYLPLKTFTPVWDDAMMAAIQPFQDAHQVPPGPGRTTPRLTLRSSAPTARAQTPNGHTTPTRSH